MIKSMLLVFLGGGAGSMLRYGAGRLAAHLLPASFPWGTFAVNLVGSFAAGLLLGWLAARAPGRGSELHLLMMTGLLGGFTTFSAFSVETLALASRDRMGAAIYVLATLVSALTAAAAGLWLSRWAWPAHVSV